MNALETQLHAHGYVISPNNPHHQAGRRMYPGGPGIDAPKIGQDVQVTHDRIRIFKLAFFGKHYSRESWWDTVTIAVFDNVPAFMEWCKKHGEPSLPGIMQPSWID